MKSRFIALFSLFFSQFALADFNAALTLYESGDFASAFQEFNSMAQLSEKRSQFNLGVMYYNGQHVEKDINKAYAWIKLATLSETSNQQEKEAFTAIATEVVDKKLAEAEYEALKSQFSAEILLEKLYPVFVKPEKSAPFSATPKRIIEPKYPRNAAINGISGWVRFQFDIDKKGAPRNIILLESVPENVFEEASIKVIKKWRFEPALDEHGLPMISKDVRYSMEFQLGKNAKVMLKEDKFIEEKAKAMKGDALSQFKVGFWLEKFSSLDKDENPGEWYLKSATQNFPLAQYMLGRSLVKGQGCMADKAKGIDWLTRAAMSGQSDAQQYLALLAIETETQESHLSALRYFSEAQRLDAFAQIEYARLLVESPYKNVKNPQEAIRLMNTLPEKNFWDNATPFEIKAAAFAALGDFKQAVEMLEAALNKAEKMHVDVSDIESRLSMLRQNKVWF